MVEELILSPWLRRNLALPDRTVIVLPNPVAADVLVMWIPTTGLCPGGITQGNCHRSSAFAEQRLQVLCP